jgi:hypothetical protein
MPRWSKIALKTLGVIFILIFIGYISIAIYVNYHKKELLTTITQELNKNLDGSLVIGSMEPSFLKGFPGVSITLKNVVIKDKEWARHKHTFLDAKLFDISVNPFGLFRGAVEINKITISDASIYLYTDSNGYSNTAVFKPKKKVDSTAVEKESSSAEIKKMFLNNVSLVLDNQKGRKLFQFSVQRLASKIDYNGSGWKARVDLKTLAKSLAFNTRRGSFIKNQLVEGQFDAEYTENTGNIQLKPNQLKIGDDNFQVDGVFKTSKDPVEFSINITADKIMWKSASALLAPNIKKRLDRFNLESSLSVACNIAGNMGPGGDPKIVVAASIKDNKLTTPAGVVDQCSFKGLYTNDFIHGHGNTDSNSVVKLIGFKGNFEGIPVSVDTANIINFIKPIATGVFQAKFPVTKLNNVLGTDVLKFTDGIADVQLRYKASLIDLVATKPEVTGYVNISKADMNYVPRGLRFKDTDISLKMVGPDLFINNLRVQSGKSVVYMGGTVMNFMNLYYSSPDKIVFNWDVRSPELNIGEFMGFLGSRTQARPQKQVKKGNLGTNLSELFEKSKMDIHLRVDRLVYKKFLGTNAVAQLYVSEGGIAVQKLGLKHAGGAIDVSGNLYQSGPSTRFVINSNIRDANIKSLFYGFDNFGLKALGYQNLSGQLGAKIGMSGRISSAGLLAKNSLRGNIVFDLRKGNLLNFDPLISVGKFAFPLRDLNNITFSNLHGALRFNGEKVEISPMKVSSSVLNVDISGVYSMGSGTNIALDVPLRNPKKDKEILDATEKAEKRMKGIVLHLLATDGEDGKIKIKLNRNRDKEG